MFLTLTVTGASGRPANSDTLYGPIVKQSIREGPERKVITVTANLRQVGPSPEVAAEEQEGRRITSVSGGGWGGVSD